jgi:hypothetical protein
MSLLGCSLTKGHPALIFWLVSLSFASSPHKSSADVLPEACCFVVEICYADSSIPLCIFFAIVLSGGFFFLAFILSLCPLPSNCVWYLAFSIL